MRTDFPQNTFGFGLTDGLYGRKKDVLTHAHARESHIVIGPKIDAG